MERRDFLKSTTLAGMAFYAGAGSPAASAGPPADEGAAAGSVATATTATAAPTAVGSSGQAVDATGSGMARAGPPGTPRPRQRVRAAAVGSPGHHMDTAVCRGLAQTTATTAQAPATALTVPA